MTDKWMNIVTDKWQRLCKAKPMSLAELGILCYRPPLDNINVTELVSYKVTDK